MGDVVVVTVPSGSGKSAVAAAQNDRAGFDDPAATRAMHADVAAAADDATTWRSADETPGSLARQIHARLLEGALRVTDTPDHAAVRS